MLPEQIASAVLSLELPNGQSHNSVVIEVKLYLLGLTDLYQICELNYFIRNNGQLYARNSKDPLKQLCLHESGFPQTVVLSGFSSLQ